jgi:hypothetical protein
VGSLRIEGVERKLNVNSIKDVSSSRVAQAAAALARWKPDIADTVENVVE